jgi:hypothetical protein
MPCYEWLNLPFVLRQSKIKVSFDFTLGLQPILQLVTWQPPLFFSKLFSFCAVTRSRDPTTFIAFWKKVISQTDPTDLLR